MTQLAGPTKAACSPDGTRIAVADTGHDRVLVVMSVDGKVVAEHGDLRAPHGVRFGPSGDLFVCEPRDGRVVRLAPDGSRAAAVEGLGAPQDVAVAADGSAVVADSAGHRVWRVPIDADPFVLAGSGADGLRDGPGVKAVMSHPSAVAIGLQGVFVADAGASALRVIDRIRRVATLVGRGGDDEGLADGPATAARLRRPTGVAPAPDGSSIYVADTGNNRLRLWSGVDGELRTIEITELGAPGGLDVLPDGRLVVADTGHDRVVLVDVADGSVRSLIG